ncbi:MAG TPA: catalase [Bacteroidia bacterium]|jgi:catalase|nr:catalase [Bacteroidia bacterium]
MKTEKSKKPHIHTGLEKLSVKKEKPFEPRLNSYRTGDDSFPEKIINLHGYPIAERIPFSKAIGAYGTFTCTNNLQNYTRAKIFKEIGKATKIFTRFSVLGDDNENYEAEPHIKEFAVRFFTEDGNWDLAGSNTPVLISKDFKKYYEFFQLEKRDEKTNLKNTGKIWNFLSTAPESLHHIMMTMSDRGAPCGYKHMNGYGAHTFSITNKENQKFWIKIHFKTLQQIKTFTREESLLARAEDTDYIQRDLVEVIYKKQFPKWSVNLQIMTDSQAKELNFNPFDVTKTWPKKEFPLIEAGIIELNVIPENYCSEVKQAGFSFSNTIDGISHSPDKILQGRLHFYTKKNHEKVADHLFSDNYFCTPESWYDYNTTAENDYYSQPSILFNKVMVEPERANLIENIVVSMRCINGLHRDAIIKRQLYHWFRVDEKLGSAIASGLNVNSENILKYQELIKI